MPVTNEIYWLTLTAAYTLLLVFPYAFVRIRRLGFLKLLTNPLPGDDPFEQAWAHRAYRAHMNAIENLVVFAPLAVAVTVTNSANDVTAMACAVYFWARVVHAPFYILNTPYIRFISYFIGVGACFVLAYQLLT
ncbi:MAG: MAPEG family protein [Gammaproteobacteria bacterium]|nr:MAPEG family protein [Gammaproteobacteria bacterium]